MKKANIFIIFILTMLIFIPTTFAFEDIEGHWAEKSICEMEKYKVINGYPDGSFRPDSEMTRAEFIKIVVNMLKLEKESSKYIPDVSRQDWYCSDIRKAVEAGIIQGDIEGYIHPNSNITREEAVVILSRAFKIIDNNNISKTYIDESEISSWAKDELNTFSKNGYLTGYEDSTIRPKDYIKRAETLTIIHRIIPNFLQADVYTGIISGNVLVNDNNVTLKNVTIDGTLIIPDYFMNTLFIKDVEVKQNIIIVSSENRELDKIKEIRVEKKIIALCEEKKTGEIHYISEKFGIEFAVPSSAKVVEISGDTELNFKKKDLIVIDIKENAEYYLKSIQSIGKEESRKYANLFSLVENGKIQNAEYVLYDDKESAQMIVIKRDSIVYTLIFFNVVSDNFVDNVLSTTQLLPLPDYQESQKKIYKNAALSLKFTYQDVYVVVDDSYNTNNVNSDNGFFKLFIQVNTITDMQKYSLDEIKTMLSALVKNDGEILDISTSKIMNNDAIKFKIKGEEKTIYSLYVIVGNNLYNFIFTGEEMAMDEVGETLFQSIIDTLEF